MYKVKVDEQFNFDIVWDKDELLVNGAPLKLDIHQLNKTSVHVLFQNKSHTAELIDLDKNAKTCTVRVNSQVYKISLTDQFDELLHRLGMDKLNALKVAELKAPMPGLVLKVLVKEGEEVKKGSSLLILEAMKMENIIKSPGDLVVRSIKVNPSDKVEKNQVMIVFS